ncbi:hypothetical protein AMECASPLE_019311 [Ameca splendens]|uniref:Uncharacterized protein n=1 Tax=Ameca splendens TaxID=208324 RepID=A0ABV0YE17_9TELE
MRVISQVQDQIPGSKMKHGIKKGQDKRQKSKGPKRGHQQEIVIRHERNTKCIYLHKASKNLTETHWLNGAYIKDGTGAGCGVNEAAQVRRIILDCMVTDS